MADLAKMLDELDAATLEYEQAERARNLARGKVIRLALGALRGGAQPGDVYARVPFTSTQMRNIARDAGIPPGRPGLKVKGNQATHDDEP